MRPFLLFLLVALFRLPALAQGDLLSQLENDSAAEKPRAYTSATFKSTRVVTSQSTEIVSPGELDFRISHRFGRLNSGAYEAFGLDQATLRLGFEYGISPWLMAGVGRSSLGKTYDAFLKIKLLRQTDDGRMPVTVLYVPLIEAETVRYPDSNYLSRRLTYTHQLIIGSKLSDKFSLQLMPALVHRNFVPDDQKNDILAAGIGGRMRLTRRTTLNADYFHVPDASGRGAGATNPFSVGVDIETGGHVFQLHLTNSPSMTDGSYITRTRGDWFGGDIHFGFNISRVFTISG